MIRRILAIGILFMLTISAAAQDTVTVRAIPTPFYGPVFRLSPDGTLLAVHENQTLLETEVPVPVDLPILLIDAETGSEVGRLEGPQVDVARSVAFSPDGTQLASYHVNGDLIVWDVATQEAIQVYDWLPLYAGLVEYMPDGKSLAIITFNGIMGQHLLFDLTTGSITDILSVRPDTYAQLSEQSSDTLSMGIYSIATQNVGPNGELYGATGNGDVYRWDTETRLRELLYPAPDEQPLRYTVRQLQVLADGTLAFLDNGTNTLVHLSPDGTRSEYTLNGMRFAESEQDLVVAYDPSEDGLYSLDLNAGSTEPQRLEIDLGVDEEGEPIELKGDLMLAFTPEGNLVLGGIFLGGGESAIYILEFP